MIFVNQNHENFCRQHFHYDLNGKMIQSDIYRQSLIYLLGLSDTTRKHASSIFDFEDNSINPEALNEAWQTSSSLKITRLAFNLWNGFCNDDIENSTEYDYRSYSPSELFCCSYAPYFFEAIKLRYPDYQKG